MIHNAIIVHGKPSKERYDNPHLPKPHKANWLPWVSRELEQKGIHTEIPEMPKPYSPDYKAWAEVFPGSLINEATGLIGHSAGAEFLLRWVSEHPELKAEQLVLVAPYTDNARKYGEFSQYQLDTNLGKRIGKVTILNSLDDSEAIQQNAQRLANDIPEAQIINLNGYGHFMLGNAMLRPEFLELLDVLSLEVR